MPYEYYTVEVCVKDRVYKQLSVKVPYGTPRSTVHETIKKAKKHAFLLPFGKDGVKERYGAFVSYLSEAGYEVEPLPFDFTLSI